MRYTWFTTGTRLEVVCLDGTFYRGRLKDWCEIGISFYFLTADEEFFVPWTAVKRVVEHKA